jgi:hypothetical protein
MVPGALCWGLLAGLVARSEHGSSLGRTVGGDMCACECLSLKEGSCVSKVLLLSRLLDSTFAVGPTGWDCRLLFVQLGLPRIRWVGVFGRSSGGPVGTDAWSVSLFDLMGTDAWSVRSS